MPRAKPKPITFEAEILGRGPNGAWAYVCFPLNASEIFGRKGQMPIRGTINGFEFPKLSYARGGIHIIGISKELQFGHPQSPEKR